MAFAISAASSPFVVLPLFMAVLAYHVSGSVPLTLLWTAVPASAIVGVPLLYILVGVRLGRLTDVHVRLREQRSGPFVAAIIGSAVAFGVLAATNAPTELIFAAAAAVLNGALMLLITLRWKISMHPSVLTACAVIVGRIVHPVWFSALATLPAVVWARQRRGRHTLGQGVAGIMVTLLVTLWLTELYLARRGVTP